MQTEPQVNILLVDDRPENLTTLEAVLADLGQNLVKAQSGAKALRFLLENDAAVILLDVQMPELDGFETAALIRERPRTCQTPIIFLTAYGPDQEALTTGYTLGAVDYLFKPFPPHALKSKVAAFVDLARKTEQLRQHREELEREVAERTAELARANEALAVVDRHKDEFLATLVHELRNPLGALSNSLEVLRQRMPEDAALRRACDVQERQLALMTRLVGDLMDLSRVKRGKLELRKERLDLVPLLGETAESIGPVFEARGLRLDCSLPAEPVCIEGDSARLTQVFTNLLQNAAKYTEPGGRVTLGLERLGAEAQVRVGDTGIGIPPELLPRLFDRFMQAERLSKQSRDGLGLGLALVWELVRLHGGRVEAASGGPGRGSEFTVRLPLLPEAAADGASSANEEVPKRISRTRKPARKGGGSSFPAS